MERVFPILLLLATVALVAVSPGSHAWAAEEPTPEEAESERIARKLLEEDRKLIYDHLQKSEALAVVLSVGTGFGAGNYYCGNTDVAIVSTVAQSATLVFGLMNGSSGVPATIGITLILRAADAIWAGYETGHYNENLENQYRAKTLYPLQTTRVEPGFFRSSDGFGAGLSFNF